MTRARRRRRPAAPRRRAPPRRPTRCRPRPTPAPPPARRRAAAPAQPRRPRRGASSRSRSSRSRPCFLLLRSGRTADPGARRSPSRPRRRKRPTAAAAPAETPLPEPTAIVLPTPGPASGRRRDRRRVPARRHAAGRGRPRAPRAEPDGRRNAVARRRPRRRPPRRPGPNASTPIYETRRQRALHLEPRPGAPLPRRPVRRHRRRLGQPGRRPRARARKGRARTTSAWSCRVTGPKNFQIDVVAGCRRRFGLDRRGARPARPGALREASRAVYDRTTSRRSSSSVEPPTRRISEEGRALGPASSFGPASPLKLSGPAVHDLMLSAPGLQAEARAASSSAPTPARTRGARKSSREGLAGAKRPKARRGRARSEPRACARATSGRRV